MLSVRIPLAAFFIASAAANATECFSDVDCATNEICALSDCGSSCDPDDPACEPSDCSDVGECIALDPLCASDADCAEGQLCAHNDCAEACDPADAECVADCSGGICVDIVEPPPSCEVDSDCEGGDVCIVVEVDCGGGSAPCDPTTGECPDTPPETDCGSGSVGYCGPAYLGECEADADCGPGFTCEAESASTCACSGPDDGSEPVCECDEPTETGPGVCVLELVPCSTDEDCSNDFVCFPAPSVGTPEPETDCGGSNPETDCGNAAEPVSGYCAPADYAGTPGGEVTVGGEEARNDDTGTEDIVDEDGFAGDFILCASNDAATPRALLPFAALAVFLRRRRR